MMQDRIDSLLSDWNTPNTPGCVLGVVRGGELIFCAAYGVRDIATGEPIDDKTEFDIASEAKQFTGACILLLADEGRLDLQADVHEYIPELPDYGHRITLDHLAHHTSGIPEYYEPMADAGLFREPCTASTVLDFLSAKGHLDFMPGDRFSYSNSGYVLLAVAVERATGIRFAQFVDKRLFRPLCMTASFVADAPSCVRPDVARGHDFVPGRGYIHRELRNYAVPGPGSVFSTVRDLSQWACALQGTPCIFRNLGHQMLTPGTLCSGEKTKYGFGLDWGQCFTPTDELRIITHSGMHAGFRSVVLRLPDHDLSVILLCNTRNIDHCKIARAVADLFMEEEAPNQALHATSGSARNPHRMKADVGLSRP